MARQLLGKEVTAALNEKIKGQVAELKEKGVEPTLGIIRVGEREDDLSYERGAVKRCETLGVSCKKILLPADVSQEALMEAVRQVNEDDGIHGVLIFRPLPKHLDEEAVIRALDPAKDVDGITDGSLVGVFAGREQGFPPCTPQACMEILDHYQIDCTGKKGRGSRQEPCGGKTGGHDAGEEKRYGYHLPYKDQGHALCSERGGYRSRSRGKSRGGGRDLRLLRARSFWMWASMSTIRASSAEM